MRSIVRSTLVLTLGCATGPYPDLFRDVAPPADEASLSPDTLTDGEAPPPDDGEAPPSGDDGAGPARPGADPPSAVPPDETTPPEPLDTAPPRLIATEPHDGARGVTASTAIVLTFSEPMDRRATTAALLQDGLEVPSLLEWSESGLELRLLPARTLEYAAGSAEIAPLRYTVELAASASDAAGNPLEARSPSFQTLRRVTQVLTPIDDPAQTGHVRGDGDDNHGSACRGELICAGDDRFTMDPETRSQYRGFISFDLAELPEELVEVVDAELSASASSVEGDPFGALGQLHIERAQFESVSLAAFDAPPHATFGVMTSPSETATARHMLWAVNEDRALGALHQYRLSFDRSSNRDLVADVVQFLPSDFALRLTYLIP